MRIKFLDICSPDELAELLDFTYDQLAKIIYGYPPHIKYKTFRIKKRSGGERTIYAPCRRLKEVQKKLSENLYLVYNQKKPAHGFCKNRSVVTNANEHLSKRCILNIDLENFFGAIHFGRVRNMFMSKPYELPHNVATVLAQICCHNNMLPQGAPTSPIVSNMISRKLDSNLSSLAARHYATYTRYADDITFSFTCSLDKVPRRILYFTDKGISLGDELEEIIKENGFCINRSKIRLCRPSQRLEVTGITVNESPNVKRSYVRRIQSMLYAWDRFGKEAAQKHYVEKYSATHRERASGFAPSFDNVLYGKINYLKMVRGPYNPIYRTLAYRYSVLTGKPREYLIEDIYASISNSLFRLINNVDSSEGTAFLLKGRGLLTCNHNVKSLDSGKDLSDLLEVYKYTNPKKKLDVEIVERSVKNDWAILRIVNEEDRKDLGLTIGDSSKLKIGSQVMCCGLPEHNDSSSLSPYFEQCCITQKRNYLGYEDVFLVAGTIVHGHSGGPVLNQKNEVVGIVAFGRESEDEAKKSIFNGLIPLRLPTL